MNKKIFVFSSNLACRHNIGDAKYARLHHGAIYSKAWGIQGDSYAIPTKSEILEILPLKQINEYVKIFLTYAREHPELEFNVTAIGCKFTGYKPKDIAPMFLKRTDNVLLPEEFKKLVGMGI